MAREQFQTLSEPMYYILLALKEECCGVDLRAKVLDLSCGRVQVGSGTLYAMFSRFEENNIIQKTDQKGRKNGMSSQKLEKKCCVMSMLDYKK